MGPCIRSCSRTRSGAVLAAEVWSGGGARWSRTEGAATSRTSFRYRAIAPTNSDTRRRNSSILARKDREKLFLMLQSLH